MGSRERPASALDGEHVDDPPTATAAALAEAAEAEAVAAEAEARAAAAHARAIRLRRQAVAADHTDGAETADPDSTSIDAAVTSTTPARHRPGRKVVAIAATIAICGSLAASGYMMWHHQVASQEKKRAAEFATAARQDVMILMSLDFNKTDDDMKRIADIATGRFKERFPVIADEMSKRLQQSKVVTTATVNDVAVESMTDNSATVLVAATTTANKPDGAQEPQSWHIALGLSRDGEQPKISSIEFIQ